jgi:clan AA aspartic protease
MGLVYADITLINGDDLALSRRYLIGEDEIRQMTVKMLVDTGSYNLCINEEIQAQLQFPVVETRKAVTADGRILECEVVSNVEVRFKNRATTCRAMVLPGNSRPVFGYIPLQDMDVIFDNKLNEMRVNPAHPYFTQMKLPGVR